MDHGPLYSTQDVALLPVVRPLVDWRAVAAARTGRRSPLAALTPLVPGEDRVRLAEVGRIAGVGRAAAANWRRRHDDFLAAVGGTTASPEFDRALVVAWLLAHGKIAVPAEAPSAALAVAGAGGGSRRFRMEDPHLLLADDAADEDRLSGWSTDEDADTLAALSAGTFGLTVTHLATPGTPPLAVLGEARVIDRFRSGSGGLRLTPAWPAGPRGAAAQGRRAGWCATVSPMPGRVTGACAGATTAAAWSPSPGARSTATRWGRCWSGTPKAGSAARPCAWAVWPAGALSADLLGEVGEGVCVPELGEAFGGFVGSADVDDAATALMA
ncbi:hypothetical protein [Streptomyces sp. NPDC048357]|uniref:hypothetical protein n=1 Tax=Streptomyces sp. NPDC048357 TaxID=3154719 RepID=UPI003445D67F